MGDRLRQAREAAGYKTATDAAIAIGAKEPTYLAHENGTRGLARSAQRYAAFYRINLGWLLQGKGPMRGQTAPKQLEVAGHVGAGAVVLPPTDDRSDAYSLDYLDPPEFAGLVGLVVRGDSQYPRWLAGEIILRERDPVDPSKVLRQYAVVDTADGRQLVKLVERGTDRHVFRLVSHNAPPEEDVEILRAYRVRGTLSW